MKRTLSLLLILSVAAANAQPGQRVIKQGPVTKNYEGTSQVRYKGQFKDDKPVGKFTYYLKSGEMSAEVEHAGNGVSYAKNYHRNGKLASQGKFVDQKKDSTWVFYNENGELLSKEDYQNDLKNGKSLVFHTSGSIAFEKNYVADKLNGRSVIFYENGKPQSEDIFVNDQLNGVSKIWYANGNLQVEGTYVKGFKTGTWKFYNEDASLKLEQEYVNNTLTKEKRVNGVFEEYFDNELLKAKYTYKNGKPDGPFVEYQEGGTWEVMEKEDPRTQEKDSYRVPKNHRIQRKGTYTAGKLNGKIEVYGPNGMVVKTENYVNGQLQ